MCPTCGKAIIFDKADVLDDKSHVCASCGADVTCLVRVEPVECRKNGLWCAYPCKGFGEEPQDSPYACPHHTPLSRPPSEESRQLTR